ncbi:hypothetical protein [Desulfovibrio gilichinskyi]|uniref:Uncharacterized protein n=1 Tax=Desulfovibrio gilichinskyi TaxID=1519643 RepID=A0A1X7DCM4_9BACT|nr:hypothetical protein [Desulfovibrio gilichinskyi]SMF12608.1 hypothetical protein SAMN06295933_1739 [Desulfovibrio gilichinskyi]
MSISAIGSSSFINDKPLDIANIKNSEVNSLYNANSAVSERSTDSLMENLPAGPEPSESELEQKAYLTYLEKYIRSYGAPEELDRSSRKNIEPTLEDEKEKLKKKAKKIFNPDALETVSKTIQDPEKEEKIKVVVSKADEDGNLKITRIMTFGPKDGNKKSEDNKENTISNNVDSEENQNDDRTSSVTKDDKV